MSIPFRIVRRCSLSYTTAALSSIHHSSGGGGTAIDLAASPMLQRLHAIIMLGSKDISDSERAIYDAFVNERCNALLERDRKTTISSVAEHQHKAAPTSIRQPFLVCADGGLLTPLAAASPAPSSTALPSSSRPTSIVFDALCGDFDSLPQSIVDAMSEQKRAGEGGNNTEFDENLSYFHVTTLYENDCHLVNVQNDPSPKKDDDAAHGGATSSGSVHQLTTDAGDAARALSDALNLRQKSLFHMIREQPPSEGSNEEKKPLSAPALVVKVSCQNTTDFEKCCQLLQLNSNLTRNAPTPPPSPPPRTEKEAAEADSSDSDTALATRQPRDGTLPQVLVLGALGGRLDHEFAALNTLFRYSDTLDLTVYNGKNTMFAVPGGTITSFTRNPRLDSDTVGVLVFGNATNAVVTKGLQWDLGPTLQCGFGQTQSTSNKIVGIQKPTKCNENDENNTLSTFLRSEADSPLTDLENTFLVDTRRVPDTSFVLITIPRHRH